VIAIKNKQLRIQITNDFNSLIYIVNDKKSLIRYCKDKYIADTNNEKEEERVMFFNWDLFTDFSN